MRLPKIGQKKAWVRATQAIFPFDWLEHFGPYQALAKSLLETVEMVANMISEK